MIRKILILTLAFVAIAAVPIDVGMRGDNLVLWRVSANAQTMLLSIGGGHVRLTHGDLRCPLGGVYRSYTMPTWGAALAFATYPTLAFIRRPLRRRRRKRRGLCLACGYDLRANTSGVCPECGQNVERT